MVPTKQELRARMRGSRATMIAAIALACSACDDRTTLAPAASTSEAVAYGAAVQRVLALDEAVVAFDLRRSCRLEVAADVQTAPAQWMALDLDAIVTRRFRVLERHVESSSAGRAVVLRVQDDLGNRVLLRNSAAQDGELAQAWRCVVAPSIWEEGAPRLRDPLVELRLPSADCPWLAPLLGSAADASLSPYTVIGFGLFAADAPTADALARGQTGVVVGIRLASADGRRHLTVAANDLDRCFAKASPERSSPGVLALAEWHPTGSTPPPTLDERALGHALGGDLDRCSGESPRAMPCAVPMAGFANLPWPSRSGGAVLVPVRMRVVESWLAPAPAHRLAVQVTGRRARALRGSLARSLSRADRSAWSASGFVLSAEGRDGATGRVIVDLDTIGRAHHEPFLASPPPTSRAAVVVAQTALEQTGIDLTAAQLEDRYAGAIGQRDDAYLGRRSQAARDAAAAVDRARATGPTATSTAARRASARLQLGTGRHAGTEALALELAFPADAAALDPDILASALVDSLGDAVAARLVAGDLVGAAGPSDRALSIAAMRAASGRPVSAIARLGDARGQVAPGESFLPVRLPPDAAARCFAFVARAASGAIAALELGTLAGNPARFIPLARDARQRREAAFDVCGLAPGDYVVHTVHDSTAAVGIFDSTARAPAAIEPTAPATTIEARPAAPPSDGGRLQSASGSSSAGAADEEPARDVGACERSCLALDDGSSGSLARVDECEKGCGLH